MTALDVVRTPLGPTLRGGLGVLVDNLEFAGLGVEAMCARLRALLSDHLVVVVKGALLGIDEFQRLAEGLGELVPSPFVDSVDGRPGILRIVREADETETMVYGGGWHSDWSFLEHPPRYTMLQAVDVPTVGGTTAWCDNSAVLSFLSSGLRSVLESSRAVHTAQGSFGPGGYFDSHAGPRSMRVHVSEAALARQAHDCVVRDPSTGRAGLYVNTAYAVAFESWTDLESKPLLTWLFELCRWEEFTVRYKVEKGDLVIWDNRFVCHRAVRDYDGERRELLRATVRVHEAGTWC